MKAGELVYFASKVTVKMVAVSWLVAIKITAANVAKKTKNLNRRWHAVLVLPMDSTKKNKE